MSASSAFKHEVMQAIRSMGGLFGDFRAVLASTLEDDNLAFTAAAYAPAVNQVNSGTTIELTDGTGVAVTLPKNAPKNYKLKFVQAGAGALTLAAESGGSIVSPGGKKTTRVQYSALIARVRSNNDGASAAWILEGDFGTT